MSYEELKKDLIKNKDIIKEEEFNHLMEGIEILELIENKSPGTSQDFYNQ